MHGIKERVHFALFQGEEPAASLSCKKVCKAAYNADQPRHAVDPT
jgi:hypothetical protein